MFSGKIALLTVLFLVPLIMLVSNDVYDTYASASVVDEISETSDDISQTIKFDDGLYQKIQKLAKEELNKGASGASGKSSVPRYYDLIVVVSRDDGDDRDPDDVARENKDAIVKRLKFVNAVNINPAETLSFVTASVPIDSIIDFAKSGEVYKIGDGELLVEVELDMARETIHATSDEISLNGIVLNGTGVKVAVIDSGINHDSLNDKVIERVTCDENSCNNSSLLTFVNATHGTRVAQVIAASDLPTNNGIAPGVELLDVNYGVLMMINATKQSLHAAQSLDWSLTNGADVANNSWGVLKSTYTNGTRIFQTCSSDNLTTTMNLILNEAVDKGMILVKSAGNDGNKVGVHNKYYTTITNPGCAHNIITVGGIDDRDSNNVMSSIFASKGPTDNIQPRLKPEIVASATGINLLGFSGNNTMISASGTSFSAPQVTAAVALLLQAKPDLTPIEIKSALLLGADWQGPIPCTSVQYEVSNATDNCSYAKQPSDSDERNNAASLGILNNVGFGILNANQTISYASERTIGHSHILGDFVDTATNTKQYSFTVTDPSNSVKIILSWLVHPHGSITEQFDDERVTPSIANLGFTVTDPNGIIIQRAESQYQTNEFAVFMPNELGTHIVTVTGTGLDTIIKPVQNYAIASTHSIHPLPTTFTNTAPVAQSGTIIINPNHAEPIPIRLFATDQNNDPVSFSVSRDPTSGTVSTDEFITNTVSRVLYNNTSASFTTDSFEVTPQDGITTGAPGIITLQAESLPSHTEVAPSSENIKKWDTVEITEGFTHTGQSETFSGPGYPISALYVGSINMEGVDMSITTSTGTIHTMAVPSSGTRMIELTSPITINSITLSADGIDEEAGFFANRDLTINTLLSKIEDLLFNVNDVRMFAGHVPQSCSGAADSCLVSPTYSAKSSPNSAIPDSTRTMSTANTIAIPVNGTINSISATVDITHTYIGDLQVILTAPDNTQTTLHGRAGGSANDIQTTYLSSTHAGLASLRDSFVAGNWTMSVGDYARGDIGTFNKWGLDIAYSSLATGTPGPQLSPSTIFSDNFDSLTNWTETGDGDWRISTSQSQLVPTAPNHEPSNNVLHSDNCDVLCTMELAIPLDLTQYSTATLSFLRFVDSGLDRDEYLKVELYDGNSWNTIYHWSGNIGGDDNTWHSEEYSLSGYLDVNNFKIRLVTQQSSSSEDVQIDDVTITSTGGTSPPATTPPPTVTPPEQPVIPSAYSIYVANTDDREIRAYSSDGTLEGTIIPRASGGLGKPWDLQFGPDGHIYVSDNTYNKIRKYNGITGSPMGSGFSAEWASTGGYPYGLDWNGNTLYVATHLGIERFNTSGTSLGLFGDAKRNPTNTQAESLLNPYDVVFCSDNRMYVSDRSANQIAYYLASDGSYLGKIYASSLPTAPDTRRATGLDCGSAITGTGNSLYQSGDDGGRINEINSSTGALKTEFTSLVDEPYGMDMDSSGNLYAANKDDDNVIKIDSDGTVVELISDRLDDPRGVEVGPRYVASGTSGAIRFGDTPNDSPEISLLQDGSAVLGPMTLSSDVSLQVQAEDAEGDTVSIGVIPGDIGDDLISVTKNQNNSAVIDIAISEMTSGTYVFWVTVSDDQDNYEREPYAVIIP